MFLDQLVLGSVNRSTRSWSEPSGKGVNVALALLAHGHPVRAAVPIGGSVGAQLRQMLNRAELDIIPVPVAGEIRSNVSLTQPDGTVTKINELGPKLSAAEADALMHAVRSNLDRVSWLVCGGSLPAGIPAAFYAALTEKVHQAGVKVVVDSSGEPLAASLAAQGSIISRSSVSERIWLSGAAARRQLITSRSSRCSLPGPALSRSSRPSATWRWSA